MKGLWIDDDWCFQRIFSGRILGLHSYVTGIVCCCIFNADFQVLVEYYAFTCELTWCFCKDPFLGKMGFDSNGKPVLQISWTCARGAVEFLLTLLHPFFDFDNHQHGDGDLLFPMLFQTILLFNSGCRHAVEELQKTCVALPALDGWKEPPFGDWIAVSVLKPTDCGSSPSIWMQWSHWEHITKYIVRMMDFVPLWGITKVAIHWIWHAGLSCFCMGEHGRESCCSKCPSKSSITFHRDFLFGFWDQPTGDQTTKSREWHLVRPRFLAQDASGNRAMLRSFVTYARVGWPRQRWLMLSVKSVRCLFGFWRALFCSE